MRIPLRTVPPIPTIVIAGVIAIVIATASSALCVSSVLAAGSQTAVADEAPFMAENDAAMTKMMKDMSVKPTGDVDRDFVAMMVPHHQGAIDMALAELRYGHDERLRRIAQEIVVEQQQEIAAMRLALGQPLPPSTSVPTQQTPGMHMDMRNHTQENQR
jgi:hypothetical protein